MDNVNANDQNAVPQWPLTTFFQNDMLSYLSSQQERLFGDKVDDSRPVEISQYHWLLGNKKVLALY